MTREEIENIPKNINTLLGLSVPMPTRQKLDERLNKVCELAIKALEQEPDYPVLSHSEISGLIYVYFRGERFEITKHAIKAVEAIKALEQEPKKGQWIPVTNGRGGHECNICHEYAPSYQTGDEYLSKCCPNCGVKMEGWYDA